METVGLLFFGYLQLLSSWWWIMLGTVTFLACITFALQEDDYTLSTIDALKLTIIGLVGLIPGVRDYLPLKWRIDFLTRWGVLGLESFWSFTLTFAILSILTAPLFFLLVFGTRIFDYYQVSDLAYDINSFGFRSAVALRFRKR